MTGNSWLRALALTVALSQIAGCHLFTPNATGPEGKISGDQLTLGGRMIQLRAPGGQTLGNVALQIGGQTYQSQNGQFYLPESALQELERQGSFLVLASGYVPAKVTFGKDATAVLSLALTPVGTSSFSPLVPPAGGQLTSKDGAIGVVVPPGMLSQRGTNLTLSTYTPTLTAQSQSEFTQQRALFAKEGACDQPWPCGPITQALGLMIGIDGPLSPGKLTLSYDLSKMLNGWNGQGAGPWESNPGAWTAEARQQAESAARILATFARLDALGEAGARARLASEYGLSLDGELLTFQVTVGAQMLVDGYARIEVAGFSLLGARLEVTVVSTTTGALPPAAAAPGATAVFGTSGGFNSSTGLVSGGGGNLVSGNGGNLISGNGGNLVSGGGGNLVSGGGGNITTAGPLTADGQLPAGRNGSSFGHGGPYAKAPYSNLVSGGGGNLVSGGGGNLVSGGGGNLVSGGGGNLVSGGGGNIISGGGGNVLPIYTGNMIDPASPGAGYFDEGGNIISGGGGNIISGGGGNIISGGGGNIISGGGGNIISGGGGNFIDGNGSGAGPGILTTNAGGSLTGEVRIPFAQMSGKYRVKAYEDYLWPNQAEVAVMQGLGQPLTPWVTVDGDGIYALSGIPQTGRVLVLAAKADVFALSTLHEAPGGGREKARIDAATTLVSSWVLDQVTRGYTTLDDVSMDGYRQDVRKMRELLTQTQAENVVRSPLAANAQLANSLYVSNNLTPAAFTRVATVTTVAGSGWPGFSDGPGLSAQFSTPAGLAIHPLGTGLTVTDFDGHRIRTIVTPLLPIVATLAGSGATGGLNGPGPTASFYYPRAVAIKSDGTRYVSEMFGARIRKIDALGNVTTFAGGIGGYAEGTGAAARFNAPTGLTFDGAGNLLVADYGNNVIRKITPGGTVSTLAGDGIQGHQDGPASQARFSSPEDLAVAPDGTIYVVESAQHCIRKIATNGQVTTFAGAAGQPGLVNKPGTQARFNYPMGITIDPDGNVVVAEKGNCRLRLITPSGDVSTIVGGDTYTYRDGVGPYAAFFDMWGVTSDAAGNMYVAEGDGQRVRKIAWNKALLDPILAIFAED